MKKTFKLTLNTDITIDFSSWGLSDAEQKGGYETKKLVINHYLELFGHDEFEISEKNSSRNAMHCVSTLQHIDGH